MKTLLPLLVFCITFLGSDFLSAQNSGKVAGTVTDIDNKAIDGAIVSLLKSDDSTLVKTELTGADGQFEIINLKSDSFLLVINALGFDRFKSNAFGISEAQPQVIIPPIRLTAADANTLKEVKIVSKIPFVEKKIDRTIVNPDALISNAGANALEVLEKSPGVRVDIKGDISLQGKQGVLVFIDDKPTYLSSEDLAGYLRSVPASAIGLIEIMTNPPAKYDAAGNAGIINIKMKKTKAKGFNGGVNVSYGQGFYARNNSSLNFNYRINKVNFFANASYGINNNYQDLTINRRYFDDNGNLNNAFDQNTFIRMNSNNLNAKLGMDYYISNKSTLGIVLSGFNNISNNRTSNVAELSDGNFELQNKVTAVSPSARDFNNGNLNVNYNLKIDSTGKELMFNLDYSGYDSRLEQNLLSNTYAPDNTFLSRSNLVSKLPATIDIKAGKIDYTNPLKNGALFEFGAKTSFIATENIAAFFDENNNVLTVNNDFSNNFKYKENINAAYANYSISLKKLAIQAGLRFENTAIEGIQLGNEVQQDSTFSRNYNSLFPTFFMSYKLDSADVNQLGLSFGRRIDRPNYQDMNPFTYPLDRFTLYSGNPFLKPSFAHNLELSHTYKNMITTTLSFGYVKDVVSETIEQNTSIFYSRPGNIGRQISYGISVSGAVPVKKWWTLQFYSEVMYNAFKADLYNQELDNKGTYWYIGPTNQFQLSDTWSAEISGSYQTSISYAQFVLIPNWSVQVAAAKKIWKNQGTIKLSLSDLFYSNQPGGDIKSLYNSTAGWLSYLDTRVLTLAIGYRFNKGQSLAARNVGGADSEKKRVQ